ncbi:MAG: STAS domain-containing protein [Clostridia bacterium]|nr:STAS domain-containing protein [Clostridia bacterium]
MPVTIKTKQNTIYAYLKGEIDHHTAPELRNTIDDAIIMNETSQMLVLDFSGVTFMDSSGVGLVMGRYRLASSKGKKLRVDNLSERDYKIMKMSGIEKLAQINKVKE